MRLVSAASTLALIAASPALSTTFQIAVEAEVQQEILVTGANPDFDYETYVQILNGAFEDDGSPVVWDPSQIPAQGSAGPSVFSAGQLSAVWSFDASVFETEAYKSAFLNGDLDFPDGSDPDEFDGFTIAESQVVSTFDVRRGGESVDGGFTERTEIVVGNNVVVGEGGETLDLIGLIAGRTPGFDFDPSQPGESGPTLVLAGANTWFEDACDASACGLPDLGAVIEAAVDFEGYFYGDTGTELVPQYEEFISSALFSQGEGTLNFLDTVDVEDFGAADGSSEDDPLLPAVAITDDEDNSTPPVFGFDVESAAQQTPSDFGAEQTEGGFVAANGAFVPAGTGIVFIDPEVAIGYLYEVAAGDGGIYGVVAPTQDRVADNTGYTITLLDDDGNAVGTIDIAPEDYGKLIGFDRSVASFRLTGIDPELGLDPEDYVTFALGLALDDGVLGVTQQAILGEAGGDNPVAPIPLPAGLPLLVAGLGGLAMLRRKRAA